MQTVLIIDDDVELCSMLRDYLALHSIGLRMEHTAVKGLAALRQESFDAVLLDIMLPDLNGYEVLSAIRDFSSINVLLLTTLKEEGDRIAGLEGGADDFLPKPFSPRELVARIRALVRRGIWANAPIEVNKPVAGIELNHMARVALYKSQKVKLTEVEFSLLQAFLESSGRVLSREDLTIRILERPFHPFDRSVDVHVSRLRRKLEEAGAVPSTIRTIRSSGYVFVPQESHD